MAAPNLAELVGRDVAAALLQEAKGVAALSALNGSAIKHLGAPPGHAAGVLATAPLLDALPDTVADRAVGQLANKARLAATVDATGGEPDGGYGRRLRAELKDRFDREAAATVRAKEPKPLDVPTVPVKGEQKHRGGAKARRLHAQSAPTALERQQGVLAFGEGGEEATAARLATNREVLAEAEAARRSRVRDGKRDRDDRPAAAHDDLLDLKL